MSPENQQIVYTVIDVLALLLPALLFGYAACGIFTAGARAVATPPWCVLWVLSCAWLALRGFGVVA